MDILSDALYFLRSFVFTFVATYALIKIFIELFKLAIEVVIANTVPSFAAETLLCGEEAELELEVALARVKILEIDETSICLQYAFYRRGEILQEGEATLDFTDSGHCGPKQIFPNESSKWSTPFHLEAWITKDENDRPRAFVKLSLKRGKSLPFGGLGYG